MFSRPQLVGDFIARWQAGGRPRVEDYLRRVPSSERRALAAELEAWLAVAPSAPLDEHALDEVRAEPALQGALAAVRGRGAPALAPAAASSAWPELLPEMRARAGLGLRELAERLTAAFGLGGQEGRAEAYLARLEDGELDPSRVSRRLRAALATALGVPADRFAGPAAGAALFRAASGAGEGFAASLEALSRAATSPAPEPLDELDRLFLGGPEG